MRGVSVVLSELELEFEGILGVSSGSDTVSAEGLVLFLPNSTGKSG